MNKLKRLVKIHGKKKAAYMIGVTTRMVDYWLEGRPIPKSKEKLFGFLLK
jgi:hypothetical protein